MQATTEKYGIPPLSPEAPYPSLNFDLAKLCVDGFYPIDFGTAAVAIVPPGEQDKSTFPYLQCKYKGKCFFVRAKFRV